MNKDRLLGYFVRVEDLETEGQARQRLINQYDQLAYLMRRRDQFNQSPAMHQAAVMTSPDSWWEENIGRIPRLDREAANGPRVRRRLIALNCLPLPFPSRKIK